MLVSGDTPLPEGTVRKDWEVACVQQVGGQQRLDKPGPCQPSLRSEARRRVGAGAPDTTTGAAAAEGALAGPPTPPGTGLPGRIRQSKNREDTF